MAVESNTSRIQYNGNGSMLTPYPVLPFVDYLDDSDLKVVVTNEEGVDTELTSSTDFTVSSLGVLTVEPVPVSSKVTIYRELEAKQPTSYSEGDAFPASTHERALDRLTMLAQQGLRQIASAFRFRASDGNAEEVQKIANSLFGLNAGGEPMFRTADEVKAWLSLAAPILNYPTKTWADGDERALTVPDFSGQIGSQRDTNALYVSNGTNAGDWTEFLPSAGSLTTAMLGDGVLSANSTGRAKMADGFLTLAKVAAGIFTSDLAGRAPFSAGFVNDALLSSSLDLSGKALTMPANHWRDIAPVGSVLQVVHGEYAANTSNLTATIAFDDSIPEITEGTQILSLNITPFSVLNKVLVLFRGEMSTNSSQAVAALFRDSVTSAIRTGAANVNNGWVGPIDFTAMDAPATASSVSYTVRVGPATSPLRMNGLYTERKYGGSLAATLTLMEIKG